MATFPQFTNPAQSGAPDLLNEALGTLEHQAVYGKDPSTTSALIWGYYGGRWGGFSIADGTVTLTGSSANYLVVEIATGVLTKSTATTNWNDATNYARVYKITATTVVTAVEDHRAGPGGVHGGVAGTSSSSFLSWKDPVRAATTVNGTLSTAFANGQTIDGVTLATGDRILLKNQSTASQNGIYVVAASGAPARSTDADSGTELVNATVFVSEGTTLADTLWTCSTNATITPGATSLTFTQVGAGTSFTGGTLTSPINDAPAVTLASSSTVNIGAAGSNTILISGSSTISAFDTIADGAERELYFQSTPILTHNGTSLILPSAVNITAAAGDIARFRSLGSGNWRCTLYLRASGTAIIGGITGFTGAIDTSSPNNSVNASIITASGGGTDISFIAEWKGANGFFSVQKPDGTTTGGNLRGPGSADFQSARTAAANVASGTKSALIGTTDSQATGSRSSAIGADRAVVTGDDSLVTGVRNTADAAGCFVMGHLGSSRGADKLFVRGFGGNALAENQAMYYPLRGDIAFSATPKTLTIGPGAVGPTTIPALDNSTMGGFTAHVWMKQSPNYLYAKVEGLLTRGANAAATAVVASTVTYIGRTAGTATNDWSVAVAADTTNGGLLVQCSDSSAGALIGCAADVEWHYSSM
jgi:hypothetical protein